MARLCIPSPIVEKMKKALVNGDISIQGLYDMKSSEERQAVFEKYVPKELAQFVTTKFEKAAASKNANALTNFVKEISTQKDRKSGKEKTILDRIAKLKDTDLLNPASQTATFTDLFTDMLGLKVTADQARLLSEKADNIQRLQDVVKKAQSQNLPTKEYFKGLKAANIDYHAALTDIDKYINSQTPTHQLKVATGTIGRANMLLNIPPAVVNTASNIVQGLMQGLERRIASGQYIGANSEFAIEYAEMVTSIFHETGFDISRNYAEDFRLGEHIIHSEGPGIVRKAGRGMSKLVFKYLLGYSDVASAAVASADSMSLQTAKIARKMGLTGESAKQKALEIFKEAIKESPDTTTEIGRTGLFVREQAIADAEYATWTNKGFLSNVSMGLRDWLNNSTGDLQLGYWNIPFVKTGANVIQFGIESTPVGSIMAFANLKNAIAKMNDKVSPDMKPMQNVIRLAVRSGMGMALSLILANLIPPDDFFSAYDVASQKQRDQLGLKKGVYNAVKIGGKWISLDFFGALGAGFVGMMYARKYGKGAVDTAFKYAQGFGAQVLQVPGIRDFDDLYTSIRNVLTAKTLGEAGKESATATINSVRSRVIPGIVNTIAQATDTTERQVSKGRWFDRTKSGIPGLRQTLPVKINQTTGKVVQGEGFISTMLFGARVKTANESKLIDEITRLDKLGFAPAIADIERSSSKVKGLKERLSDTAYQNALKFFGTEYGKRASRLIATSEYRKAAAEDKKDKLDKIRDDVRNEMLEKFHYRKPKNKGLKIK